MSRTINHIIEAKFNNGLIEYDEVPRNVKKKWNRHNFEIGHFRNERNKLKYRHYERIF